MHHHLYPAEEEAMTDTPREKDLETFSPNKQGVMVRDCLGNYVRLSDHQAAIQAERDSKQCNLWKDQTYCPCQDCARGLREELSRLQARCAELEAEARKFRPYFSFPDTAYEEAKKRITALEADKARLENALQELRDLYVNGEAKDSPTQVLERVYATLSPKAPTEDIDKRVLDLVKEAKAEKEAVRYEESNN
jgi:hypothetical protein